MLNRYGCLTYCTADLSDMVIKMPLGPLILDGLGVRSFMGDTDVLILLR